MWWRKTMRKTMRKLFIINLTIRSRMDSPKQAIIKATPYTIHNFIDIVSIRQYLLEFPNLLLMFEILINHIEEYIQLKKPIDITKSSPM